MRQATSRIAALMVFVALSACATQAPRAGPGEPPTMARVVCSERGTRVETPSVQAQPDGVHVVIDNRLGFDTGFSTRYANGAGEGGNAPMGGSTHVLPAPPGRFEIGCYTDPGALESDLQTLDVVDAAGNYRSTELECGSIVEGVTDYVEGAGGERGDPVDLARARFDQVTHLGADDVVEIAGYPQDPQPTVRLVRDGRVVATITYDAAGQGGWLEDTFSRCSELVA